MNNKDAQDEEVCALKSIFDDEFVVIKTIEEVEGTFFAHVDVPNNFKIKWLDMKDVREISVRFLPPIVLNFNLPESYPSESAPTFSLICEWLSTSDVSKLSVKLLDMWSEDKDVILYKWASFLKDESLCFLNISGELDINSVLNHSCNREEPNPVDNSILTSIQQTPVSKNGGVDTVNMVAVKRKPVNLSKSNILQKIIEHNKQKLQEIFDRETFECNVCFIPVLGSKCIQFQPCQHVFCKKCVKEYIEVAINEGRVQNMTCLELDCKSPVLQSHVRELVSRELFASYDELLLTVSLTSMSDVTYCPFLSCETPVLFDPDDNMASCPVCHYVFCVHCRMGYHGVEPCRIRSKDKAKLVCEYLAATGDQKKVMEKKYGKRPLQILVNNVMSQQWIDANSKPCPQCNAQIEKFDGCNKMQCWRCTSNFCWLCGQLLKDIDPYVHFRSVNSKCKGLLFHGLPDEYQLNEEEINENIEIYNNGEEEEEEEDDDEYIYFRMI